VPPSTTVRRENAASRAPARLRSRATTQADLVTPVELFPMLGQAQTPAAPPMPAHKTMGVEPPLMAHLFFPPIQISGRMRRSKGIPALPPRGIRDRPWTRQHPLRVGQGPTMPAPRGRPGSMGHPMPVQLTRVSSTQVSLTQVQPTQVPPTQVPPTQVPPTQVPPTQVQLTQVQLTQVPPTQAPATQGSPMPDPPSP
jgi:hypothetical protein